MGKDYPDKMEVTLLNTEELKERFLIAYGKAMAHLQEYFEGNKRGKWVIELTDSEERNYILGEIANIFGGLLGDILSCMQLEDALGWEVKVCSKCGYPLLDPFIHNQDGCEKTK